MCAKDPFYTHYPHLLHLHSKPFCCSCRTPVSPSRFCSNPSVSLFHPATASFEDTLTCIFFMSTPSSHSYLIRASPPLASRHSPLHAPVPIPFPLFPSLHHPCHHLFFLHFAVSSLRGPWYPLDSRDQRHSYLSLPSGASSPKCCIEFNPATMDPALSNGIFDSLSMVSGLLIGVVCFVSNLPLQSWPIRFHTAPIDPFTHEFLMETLYFGYDCAGQFRDRQTIVLLNAIAD